MTHKVDSQSCCSWQKVAVGILGVAAITAIAIGALALSGMQYDFKLFKLEDLTTLSSGGLTVGGSVSLVVLVGGVIYFQCRAPRSKAKVFEYEPPSVTDTKKAHASTIDPLRPTPTPAPLPKPLFTYGPKLRGTERPVQLEFTNGNFVTLTEEQAKTLQFDDPKQIYIYKDPSGHFVFHGQDYHHRTPNADRYSAYLHYMGLESEYSCHFARAINPTPAEAAPLPKPLFTYGPELDQSRFADMFTNDTFVTLAKEHSYCLTLSDPNRIYIYTDQAGHFIFHGQNHYHRTLDTRRASAYDHYLQMGYHYQYHFPQAINPTPAAAPNILLAPIPSPYLEEIEKDQLFAQIGRGEFGALTQDQALNIAFRGNHQVVIYQASHDVIVHNTSTDALGYTKSQAVSSLAKRLEEQHTSQTRYYRPKVAK